MHKRSIAGWVSVWLLFITAIACAQAIANLGFTTATSAALAAQYARKFGPAVSERLARWVGFAREQKAASYLQRLESAKGGEAGVLQMVNDDINGQVKWVDDKAHWGVEDYWATPAESIASDGGDCEDFSIAKYYLLKELGVPLKRLRITYVRALKLKGQAHMVLVYYANPEAEPLVLDNLDPVVRGASQRTDLEPIYSFNDTKLKWSGDG